MAGSPGGFGFGGNIGGSNSTTTQTIDPITRMLQQGNYNRAQDLTQNYTPTSAGLISSYMDPYMSSVVDQTMTDQDRYRRMMLNENADAATAAGAFGGSRHGVADALTNTGAMQQMGLLTAQLRSQGYGQALQTAQNENQFGFTYPLQRQQVQTGAVSALTPNITQKSSSFNWGLKGAVGQ